MKLQKLVWMSLSLIIAGMAAPAFAALNVGDPAPKLEVSKWAQGEAVTNFETGKMYIVEFWATWCGPCRQTIPHLNALAEKFKDQGVVVIGQDVWEKDVTKVEPFLAKMGSNMTYRVALDLCPDGKSQNGKMATNWMRAAEMDSIPCAFVVDKRGQIAWIGHPAVLNEAMIQQMVNGTFDVPAAAKQQALDREIKKFNREFAITLKAKDYSKTIAALDSIEKSVPENQKNQMVEKRIIVLMAKGDVKAASRFATNVVQKSPDDVDLLNNLAWTLATSEAPEHDFILAEQFATHANELTKGEDAMILDTLARIEFLMNKKEKAIELATLALEKENGGSREPTLRWTLKNYKEGKLPPANVSVVKPTKL